MTDLQVKYQALQLERDKLAEEKRLHNAQIGQYQATSAKLQAELPVLDAQTKKYLAEAGLTEAELAWYGSKTASEIYKNYTSGTADMMKGIGSIIPG